MLSKTAEYALRAVTCLAAQPTRSASAEFLSDQTKVPRRYLHRVLQDLATAKLLRSRPGPGGGYELTRSTREVTILDVINAVHPVVRIRECPLGLTLHTSLCPLHKELDRIYAAAEEAFRGITMKDLLESANPVVPLCNVLKTEAPPSVT